ASVSPTVRFSSGSAARAPASGAERWSHSGMPGSEILVVLAGTPALRKYFWAMMSVATCDHPLGMRISLISKTTEPSGLRITEDHNSQARESKASRPNETKRLWTERPFEFSLMKYVPPGIF